MCRLLYPNKAARQLLYFSLVTASGARFPVVKYTNNHIERGWPAVAAALQLQEGDIFALSRECPEAGCSGSKATAGSSLDLVVQKLTPLQGGALAAATAVTCPIQGHAQGNVTGWPLKAVAPATVEAAAAIWAAAAGGKGGVAAASGARKAVGLAANSNIMAPPPAKRRRTGYSAGAVLGRSDLSAGDAAEPTWPATPSRGASSGHVHSSHLPPPQDRKAAAAVRLAPSASVASTGHEVTTDTALSPAPRPTAAVLVRREDNPFPEVQGAQLAKLCLRTTLFQHEHHTAAAYVSHCKVLICMSQAQATVDAPFRMGSDLMRMPHSAAAASTFLAGELPLAQARFNLASGYCGAGTAVAGGSQLATVSRVVTLVADAADFDAELQVRQRQPPAADLQQLTEAQATVCCASWQTALCCWSLRSTATFAAG